MSEPNSINITININEAINLNASGCVAIAIDKLVDSLCKCLSKAKEEQSTPSVEECQVSEVKSPEEHEIYKIVAPGVDAQRLLSILHSLMDMHTDPKNKLKPLRATYEAGLFSGMISLSIYEEEFGKIAKSSYSRWMKDVNCYKNVELDHIISRVNSMLNS